MKAYRRIPWIALLIALIAIAIAPRPAAADRDFGLGVVLGAPTGLTGKYWIAGSSMHALDFAIGEAAVGNDGIHFHMSYLWHPWMITRTANFDLGLYIGVGGRFLDHDRGPDREDHIHIGPRVPFGLLFDFRRHRVPIDIFIEIAGSLDIILDDDENDPNDDDDGVDFDLNGALGVRYFF
jgi:hypothetical protein